jgi:hypothetical protein
MEAIAMHESGGDASAKNPGSTASGKYQMLDSTWKGLASQYYKPALQYSRAADAPAEVQDAVAYLSFGSQAIKQYNAFQMAVGWYGGSGIINNIAANFNVVPKGNTQSYGQYGNEIVDFMKAGKALNSIATQYGDSPRYGDKDLSSIPINPQAAPDFGTYLAKLGKPIPPLTVVNYGSDGKPTGGSSIVSTQPAASADTSADCAGTCSQDGGPTTGSAPTSIDLASIAKKYGLQSALVKQIGGKTIGSYQADTPPAQPASILKLIFAQILLSKNPDLDKTVTITTNEVYGPGDNYKAGQTISLRDALKATFIDSQNTTANVLLDAAGVKPGAAATAAARSLGYSSTVINNYYNSGGGTNKSTATDLSKAMEDIYSAAGGKTSGNNYADAYGYLTQDKVKFGLNSEANKWGWVSNVTGNDAVFSIDGNKYIITVYVPQGSVDQTSPAAVKVNQSTTEMVNALGGSTATSVTPAVDCSSTNIGNGNFVFYQQCDSKWANHPIYSGAPRTICTSGCGPTSAAMVVATMSNKNITPVQTGDYMTKINGYTDAGATVDGLVKAVENWGLKAQTIGTDFAAATKIVRAGGLVIAGGQGDSPYSQGGHVVVIRGVDSTGNFLIGNPSLNLNGGSNNTLFSLSTMRAGTIYMIGVTK